MVKQIALMNILIMLTLQLFENIVWCVIFTIGYHSDRVKKVFDRLQHIQVDHEAAKAEK